MEEVFDAGHRDRLRERYLRAGHDAMADYENLELLLTFAIPRRDVKPIAKRLLLKYKSLSAVFDAEQTDLESVPGVGKNAAILIRLIKGFCCDYLFEELKSGEIVTNSEDVAKYARMKLSGISNEVFLIVYLNTRNELLSSEILCEGTIDQVHVHQRELMKRALNRNARSMVLVHNHPSGSCRPSQEDRRLTNDIRITGRAMRIDLLDHLIITRDSCYSMELDTEFFLKRGGGQIPLPAVRRTETVTGDRDTNRTRALAFQGIAGVAENPEEL